MTVEPMIAVSDVERSTAWYCRLLGCISTHGGPHYDRLTDAAGNVVLMLHHWDADEHPSMAGGAPGNTVSGLELYFRVQTQQELTAAYERAVEMGANVAGPPAFRQLSHQHELAVRDPDGYSLNLCWAG